MTTTMAEEFHLLLAAPNCFIKLFRRAQTELVSLLRGPDDDAMTDFTTESMAARMANPSKPVPMSGRPRWVDMSEKKRKRDGPNETIKHAVYVTNDSINVVI